MRRASSGPGPIEWVTPEQTEFFHSVVEFARTLPRDTLDRDRAAAFSRDAWDRCGRFGIQGLPGPEAYGGGGAGAVTTMLGLEALGYGCHDNGLVFSVNAHMWTSVIPVSEFGTEEQKGRWLPGLASGELIGCHTITEPEAGSDAFAMRATGRPVEGGFLLNGRKTFITNAPVADLFIVFVRTEPDAIGPYGLTAFLVEKGTPGCLVEKDADKMGLRTSPMADVVLEDCVVPESAILGGRGHGGEIFQTSMRWERACIMASHAGLMRRTMESCVAYARQRRQFGKPIARFESVSDKIANMKIAVEASRALVLRVGWLMDNGHDTTMEAAVAKAFVSEASVRTHLDAVQVHGGYGYMTEFEVERALRDAVGGTIYSGTSEIQRRVIARGLGL
jgi:alkylation response protein AidB-like acyl-CoA dehydrogenase